MKKNALEKLLVLGALAGTAVSYMGYKKYKNKKSLDEKLENISKINDNSLRKAYLIGAGIGCLSAAAYLIRDCGFKGENISIFEGRDILGGSNDGSGNPETGFVCRGGRMLNEETYENFWELFSTIPSLENPNRSVTEEILNFDHAHPTHAKARLIDKEGNILNVKSMGFNRSDRAALLKLLVTPEERLDNLEIQDWFKNTPHFFETNFWYMWQTTFAFQKWSSLFEFKRYMERMIFEFSRIETLEGVTRTPYNQYESIILPLKNHLEKNGVTFKTTCTVTDIEFENSKELVVKSIKINENGQPKDVILDSQDICIMTNACMTDSSTLGDMNNAPCFPPETPISGDLWTKISEKRPELGNPKPFFDNPKETTWESFTVTCRGNFLLKMIENFSGNIPGNGALMTFKDSSWLMSIVVAAQPHFKNQPENITIFWGYGLYPDKNGDFVNKPMCECTGREILFELIHHLHFEDKIDDIMETIINVIPCVMPYINSQFQPRAINDRPKVVPDNSKNFAMVSQFVEIPDDMVFTEEYSVRAARIAAYTLSGINKTILPVTPFKRDPKVLIKAIETAYR